MTAVFLLTVVVLLWMRMAQKPEWITIRLALTNDEWWWEGAPPQWWYVDTLSVGQTSKNTFGETVAEIKNIESFDVGAYRRRAFVDLRLKGAYDKRRQMYLFNYQPVQIGKSLDLTFGKNNIHGIVTYVDKLPQGYTPRTIEVKLAAVAPWVAQSYKEGLTMTDSQGRPLAKILSVTTVPSTVQEVVDIGERTQKRTDGSLFRDVLLEVQIQTYQSSGVDYFVDRAAIKIGEHIWFQFTQTVAREAEITKILE